jgi:hypothetical protein
MNNFAQGRLLALLTACFYAIFTLLPDSSTLVVSWPWVFIWQIGLLCPVIWLGSIVWSQRRFPLLGNGLDWFIGLVVIGLFISTIAAEFSSQATWYSWAALCFLAALYALNFWLDTAQRRYQLLVAQGYLNLAFIILSLTLWTTQTLLPELARLDSFKQYGVNLSFDFSVLELRNWAPLGHQNYVAGYLLLALPILVGLGEIEFGWRRWLWFAGFGLGLIDLYTTSSRGGWLGLIVLIVVSLAVLLVRSSIPRLWLLLSGISTLAIIGLLIAANNRLRTLIMAILSGQGGGELAYRKINAAIGWQMGISHPFSGVGLGGVPILYQKYRPIWAGQESELTYQLHSTPAQLWAEMGLSGIFPAFGAVFLLVYLLWRWLSQKQEERSDRILLWSIYAGFLAYGIITLTDYQLDNVAISGTLVIFLAIIASIFTYKPHPQPLSCKERGEIDSPLPYAKAIVLTGLGILIAVIIWLIAIHRAWQLSSNAFLALNQEKPDFNTFVDNLTKAQELAPWESYYSYQLGWNIGNLGLQTRNPEIIADGINWLERGIKVSPYQEFAYSNLGWLLLDRNPDKATQAFDRSTQLVPAKKGVFFGLGLSLLAQNKVDLGIEAMALEILRDPIFLTSPIWRSPKLKTIYPQLLTRIEAKYGELLQKEPNNAYLHACRGGLFWWKGDFAAAHRDWDTYGTPLSKIVLEMAEGKAIESKLAQMPKSPAKLVINAWFDRSQRLELLQQAWIETNKSLIPDNLQQQLLTGMEKSDSFDRWLKQNAPILEYRRERSGFGVNSRHIDGPAPTDFFVVVDNLPMINWFRELLPSPLYDPQLDLALQAWREKIL